MENRLINISIWAFAIILCLGVLFFLGQPLIWSYPDWVVYVRWFLVLFAINTFAQLRLYNAIVQNTRFAIKLREALIKFINVIPVLERSMKNLNSTMGNVKASSDSLKKTLDSTNDATEELTEKITHIKQLKK